MAESDWRDVDSIGRLPNSRSTSGAWRNEHWSSIDRPIEQRHNPPASQAAVIGDDRLVAEDAVFDRRAAADVALAAENRSAHGRVLTDPGVRPDDRSVDGGMLLDLALAADHGVGTDLGAGL